jgi:HEAT repeat protein
LIGKLASGSETAVKALESTLSDGDLRVRAIAAAALCRRNRGRIEFDPTFRAALREQRFRTVRHDAVEGLVRIHITNEAKLRELIEGVRDTCPGDLPLQILAGLGPEATPAVPLLRSLAFGEDGSLAEEAMIVFGRIGPAAASAAEELRNACDRRMESGRRMAALSVLGSVSPGPAAAELMLEALFDPNPYVVKLAMREALKLAQHATGSIPRLVDRLRRNYLPKDASLILSRIGAPAVPALLAALDEESDDLRVWAAWSLGGMDEGVAGDAAIDALLAALKNHDDLLRAAAAHALGRMGSPAARAIEALEAARGDSVLLVRRQVTTALNRLRDPQRWRAPPRFPERTESGCLGEG